MSQKSRLVRSLLLISLLFSLVSQLALAMPLPSRNPDLDDPVAASPEIVDTDNVIQGHALTDEATPQPVQNALIVAKKTVGGDEKTTLTNASGAYTLTVPSGLSAWWVSAVVTDTTDPPDAVAPTGTQLASFLTGGPYTETVDFTFQMPSAQIVGRVLIAGTLITPTFPVTVTATGLTSVSERIDPEGFFTLTVPAGLYVVTVRPENLLFYLPPIPKQGHVSEEEPWDLGDLYLTPLGDIATLSGQVLTPDDQGVSGVQVVAYNLDRTSLLPSRATTTEEPDGDFTLTVQAGTWWVAVALGEGDDYMPYLLQWQAVVSVEPGETVNDILLRVTPADSHILGTLTEEEGGPPAIDACGLVAAFKAGEPATYDYRRFTDDTFDLPVISGTFRLAVLPNPGIEELDGFAPSECEPGKYLAQTVPQVKVGAGVSVPITVPLRVADVTIHGQLWDEAEQKAVTNWDGQIVGWSQSSWTATRVDPATGAGDLRASDGTWWLAYHIDPQSGYLARPGVVRAIVPTGTTAITVSLPVVSSVAKITGTVLDPDGAPLPWVAVTAINLNAPTTGGDKAITREDGQFTLTLDYGDYLVTAFGPPEWQEEQPWITPEPQRVTLTTYTPIQEVELRFRRGDATINGHLSLDAGEQVTSRVPALVWAATVDGHTKTWVAMPITGSTVYSLPVLQGQVWTVGAIYEVGASLWVTYAVVAVDTADVELDLLLTQPYTLATDLVQSVDPDRPFYGELPDEVAAYIPAGALPAREAASAGLMSPVRGINPYYKITLRLKVYLLIDLFVPLWIQDYFPLRHHNRLFAEGQGGSVTAAAAGSTSSSEAITLVSLPYEIGATNDQGEPVTSDLSQPAVIRIPYDEEDVTEQGFTEADLQPVYYDETTGGWEPMESFVVDEEADEVVIFADRLGTYALIATQATRQIFLPLILREFPSP